MATVYIKQAWLVLILAIVFAAALACIQAGLSPRIEANKRNETYDQIPVLVPGADQAATEEWATDDGKIAYKAVSADGEAVGWVIKGAGQGFADKIELLIGLDAEATRITGLFVLEQKETPALGSKIADKSDPWFRDQFEGKSAAEDIAVTKASPVEGTNQVAAISGATISSEAVSDIVNDAVKEFRDRINDLTPMSQE